MTIAAPRPHGRIAAGWALLLLFMANALNWGDRMLFGVVAEPIKHDLALSDTQLSLASGLFFVLVNLVGGLFIARLVDRGHRIRILGAGIALWSAATALTGYATGYGTLALARIAVGIGEASAFPAALSLIPDLFRADARGRALALFQSSNFVGIVAGTVFAGILAAALGWRGMFQACGLAGVALALVLVLTVREPARQAETVGEPVAYWPDLVAGTRRVLAIPGFVALALGLGVAMMVGSVLGAWAPAFLQRSHGVPLAEVGVVIGPSVGLGGIVGTILSGFLADRLLRSSASPGRVLRIPLVCVPLSLPFMAGFVFAPSLGPAMICAGVMNLLLSAAVPPTMSWVVNVAPPPDRALAATIVLTALGLVGGALGPFVVGVTSDALAASLGAESLRYGLATMLVSIPLATALFVQATRRNPAGS